MKPRHIFASSFIFFASIFPVQAEIFWDGTSTTGAADGGSGVWDNVSLNWSDAATGGAAVAWTDFETAVFGGAAGTVTIDAAGVLAFDVNFETTGYTITGGALGVGGGMVTTPTGVDATISAPITGAGGLKKSGGGTLVLAGNNTYSGATTVEDGTLKVDVAQNFRYYRFTVGLNSGNDGYNQIAELHFYQDGVWIPAVGGNATGTGTGEQSWQNANDNQGASVGMTKFGIGTRPYSITYDFGTPIALDAYNWATANDSTPARNPRRWRVFGSNDNTNFTLIDDRSYFDQVGPTSTFTWSGATGNFETNTNALNGGAADAFPLRLSSVPAGFPLVVGDGATFDLNGLNQTVTTLADLEGAGGTVTNSLPGSPVTLTFNNVDSATFSGTISDSGVSGALGIIKLGAGAQTLAGSESNTYSGTTTLGGNGKLVLAKTGGAIAIPGNVALSSNAFGGNNAGLVLAGHEQIADSAILTWTPNGFGLTAAGSVLAPQADTFFRLNGYTETVGGLVSTNTSALMAIENRGNNDATEYGTGHLILNVASGNFFTFGGQIRDTDASTNGLGGKVAITKTGEGTQVLAGTMGGSTGPAVVNQGVLRLNNLLGSATVTVTGTGVLEGTGTLSGLLTVQDGGVFNPGVAGAGTFSAANPILIGNAGIMSLSGGTFNGAATIASGGSLTGTGTVSGVVNVQAGAEISPGVNGIGSLVTGGFVSLAGTTVMEIDKFEGVLRSDAITGFSGIQYGGTLEIVASGDEPALGDSYQLFTPGTGGTFSGAFSSIVGLPALPAGLQWETTSLLSTGRITVINTSSAPAFGPAGGGFVGAQTVSITADPGATIYYTLDGSEPTTASLSGTSPITGIVVPVGSSLTVKSFARTPGFADSPVTTAIYRTVSVPKWIVDAAGNWGDAANWDNQVIPSGSGSIADFTLPQTANRTVTLNGSRTVGKLVFSNANPFTWTLASSTGSVLTLNTPSGKPEIEVRDVDTTISSVIAGSQAFVKSGAGTLFLTGNNTYSGVLEVNEGRLSVATLAANGASSPLGSGSTLELDGGILRYTGATNINFGTFNRAVVLGENGGTIDTSTAGVYWFTAGSFSGPGSFTKVGTRQLIVQSNSSYDGITYVNEGELQIRTGTALGSTVGKTVVNSPARLALGQNLVADVPESLELNGFGGGNGALQSNDPGVVVNWTGPILLASDSGIGGSTAFTISGPISGSGGLVKLVSNAITLSGSVSNSYTGLTTLGGTGKLILAKTGGAIAIPGDVNLSSTAFNGNNSGVVLGASEQIADTAVITWTPTNQAGGAQAASYFRLNGHTETVAGLQAVGGNPASPAIENRGFNDTGVYETGTLIVATPEGSSFSYTGIIRDIDGGSGGGTVALVKTGAGRQTIGGSLSFTGGTRVADGTLVVNSVTGGAILVESGGVLEGSGGTAGLLTVEAGGSIAPGDILGAFSAAGAVIAGTLEIDVDAASADRLTVTGNLNLTGATLEVAEISAGSESSYVIASYTGDLTGAFAATELPAGYELVHDTVAKEFRLVKVTGEGFAAFAALNGLTGTPGADFDGDGLADAIEYVLGTSPIAPNTGGPVAQVVDGNLVFSFSRDRASLTADTAVTVELSDDLVTWPTVYTVGADTASSTEGVSVVTDGETDTITLTVAMGALEKKFARLAVSVAP